jgi:hypothetical protein
MTGRGGQLSLGRRAEVRLWATADTRGGRMNKVAKVSWVSVGILLAIIIVAMVATWGGQ